ncbi:MgtC/SapB transporter [Sulfitobacter noctilucicola]|uniref:Protein MgtC n=1 Tax=Sulfitobacter noctilucicola TaxID=1342301 RepID=A0A7W6Q6I7_9RHOB|nr:MgtC/SapB family protein [Sulfitobacter noctilucicola]KIN63627.1 MgtC/SapB transporter [Sulfitobacter noctilucicola]MBB4174862.1 putative Mg2+ transporter-C (MgtC) family protein [Sulfitobacter noctilucicola]
MVGIYTAIDLSLLYAALNMACALALGAVIGSERQFRGRMAGLRTNALVSLGAAGFVTFAALFPDDINPTRVAAQVVSGIGFLGAGIIFRDGFNVQGINTAATLWCSAAVGLMSGAGYVLYASALAGLIVFTNLGLRPVVRRLKAASAKFAGSDQFFNLVLEFHEDDEATTRAALVTALTEEALTICKIESRTDKKTTKLTAQVTGSENVTVKIESVMAKLTLGAGLLRAHWTIAEEDETSFE